MRSPASLPETAGWWRRRDGWFRFSSKRAGLCLHPIPLRQWERSVLFWMENSRILVAAHPFPNQPLYESLQGRPEVGPLPTPRRYPGTGRCRMPSGFADVSPVFTPLLRAEATCDDRTRVRKPYASRHYVRSHVIVLAARYPTGREDVRPASERFNVSAWSTPRTRACERVPRFGCTSTCQSEVRRD